MKIFIETLGCPKNFNDSEMAAGILEHAGHVLVGSPEEADLIMVNTCGFINDAKTESIERIFDMAQYKGDSKILAVSGCLSQRYEDELFAEMPEVDLFLGVNDYERLPQILEGYQRGKREKHLSDYNKMFMETPFRKLQENPYTATLKIAEGCNNVCAYCVIPHIRGKYRSRRQEDIVREAEMLAENGCKELILIAQDVTAYGMDLYDGFVLPQLLRKLCRIDGLRWIRLMYCYEDRISDELIQVMAEEDKICKYIDIPLQHISDRVLTAMNRRSTAEGIRRTIGRLRQAMPDIHIRTTFITGFPGESEADFEELLDFVETTRFQRLGVFAYSQEEGTPAADMADQIDEEVKALRQDAIMRRQLDISLSCNREKLGKVFEVLVEEDEGGGSYAGRTAYDAPEIDNSVVFTSGRDLKPGDMVRVEITDAFDYDLTGKEV
ncbi:30S ribosomal protein S12 methylthiotransferase RimO [Anaerovorax odorimutans]|uniref:Ribosomal protein uS12 methylthiotransferase RimO n=1 Tax=Anaerovorax odorimutans TaxID=109327 RepID=A0ABT1RKV4_9FIRM|nr:30S ribosomal protein S12 methylthiotransferase RimO [Anaerovorax odorimutans]MCQ4635812.1 30S ribosomal protein S12 methylthiotransferase RimO [Anaerovorax odorimutans]